MVCFLAPKIGTNDLAMQVKILQKAPHPCKDHPVLLLFVSLFWTDLLCPPHMREERNAVLSYLRMQACSNHAWHAGDGWGRRRLGERVTAAPGKVSCRGVWRDFGRACLGGCCGWECPAACLGVWLHIFFHSGLGRWGRTHIWQGRNSGHHISACLFTHTHMRTAKYTYFSSACKRHTLRRISFCWHTSICAFINAQAWQASQPDCNIHLTCMRVCFCVHICVYVWCGCVWVIQTNSDLMLCGRVSTVEMFWAYYSHMLKPSGILQGQNYHVCVRARVRACVCLCLFVCVYVCLRV